MLNKIIIIGRLTTDPELRYTPSEGIAVANFTVAVNRPFKNQSGEQETDFIRVVVWRKQAENCSTYLTKGRLVAVEGRLQVRNYEDKEGIKRTIAEIVAQNVTFLPDGKGNNGNNTEENAPENVPESEPTDDDVPF